MEIPADLVRPQTLEAGHEYLLRSEPAKNIALSLVKVRFVEYDPCPAFVIVKSPAGTKRCLRDDLFTRHS